MPFLRPLTQADLPALLNFERRNRTYFEKWVAPRPNWFFEGTNRFTSHMEALLNEQQNGSFMMYVLIEKSEQIVGRINLSVLPTPSLGYRIAESHTGNGLAKTAIRNMCAIARNVHGLNEITAQAARNNPASQQALRRNGFMPKQGEALSAELNGETIWLDRFQKRL